MSKSLEKNVSNKHLKQTSKQTFLRNTLSKFDFWVHCTNFLDYSFGKLSHLWVILLFSNPLFELFNYGFYVIINDSITLWYIAYLNLFICVNMITTRVNISFNSGFWGTSLYEASLSILL